METNEKGYLDEKPTIIVKHYINMNVTSDTNTTVNRRKKNDF